MSDFFSGDGLLNSLLTSVNEYLWTYLLIGALVACGVWFTVKTRFVQFRMLKEMVRLLFDSSKATAPEASALGLSSPTSSPTPKRISSFQAFAVSLASRVGTGNLAGVATAIAVGGPGSVFWMWLIALIGAATAFVESTLAQLFKQQHTDSFIGGPAYYISKGLKSKWMAALFAVLITITFGFANNSIQTNTICGAMNEAFGISPTVMGLILTVLSLIIVFGGIQRIAKVSSVVVPVMAIGYLLLALIVIGLNIDKVPDMFRIIVENAFGVDQAIGGTVGAAMMNGIKRGLFSNEAGEGSAPNAAATASVSHPVKQGLIQSLGVFTDTLVVCSCTAFIILLSGLYTNPSLNGINLTQLALQSEVGSAGPVFVAIAILLFAYSSIIGNYYYGETNVRYLLSTHNSSLFTLHSSLFLYRILSAGVFVLFGALASLQLAWSLVDFCMALLTICNLVAILLLGKYVFRLADDYRAQRRRGIKDPVFHRSQFPEIEQELQCW